MTARGTSTRKESWCLYSTIAFSVLAVLVCSTILGVNQVTTQDESSRLMSSCARISGMLNFLSTTLSDTSLLIRCQVGPCSAANKTRLYSSHSTIYATVHEINPLVASGLRSVCFRPIETLVEGSASGLIHDRLLRLAEVSDNCALFLNSVITRASSDYVAATDEHNTDSRRTMWVSLGALCGISLWLTLILFWAVSKARSEAAIILSRHQDDMQRMLKSWNHDNKNIAGSLLSSLEELEEGLGKCCLGKNACTLHQCQALSSHVAHSVGVMSIRHAICSETVELVSAHRQSVNLSAIVEDILRIPGFETFQYKCSSPSCAVQTIPAVCYHVIYQFLRNAFVHGSGPRTVSIDGSIFSCKNGPSPHHPSLMSLPNDVERLRKCLGGATGSKTSSGIGLRDTFDLCIVDGLQVSFQFVDDGVELTCKFQESSLTTDTCCIPVKEEIPDDGVELSGKSQDSTTTDTCSIPVTSEVSETVRAPYLDGVSYRVCTVDDALSSRIQTRSILGKLNDLSDVRSQIVLDEDGQVEHPWILTLGHTPITLLDCVARVDAWISWCTDPEVQTVVLLDQNIEFPGQASILGTDILRQIPKRKNLYLMIRSGNDTMEDIAFYRAAGALDIIPKHLNIRAVLQRISDIIAACDAPTDSM